MKSKKLLNFGSWIKLAVPALSFVVLAIASANAINVPEGTSKLVLASEITRQYVVPLGLKGKPAAHAISVFLAEGFRCNLKPRRQYGTDDSPLSDCIKEPSGFSPLCDELIVTAYYERQERVLSRAELLKRMGAINVDYTLSFCPYKRTPGAEYITYLDTGSASLVEQVHAFHLIGNARASFDKLMKEGYSCGFELDPSTKKPPPRPKLICTKWPSQIKYCYEARIMMDVRWGGAAIDSSKLYNELERSQVLEVRSSCEVPEKEGSNHT